MMLEFLGHRDAHDAIIAAIETVLRPGSGAPRTPDLGGTREHRRPRARDRRMRCEHAHVRRNAHRV